MALRISAPSADDCALCDKPLGTAPLLKRRSGWVHKACWLTEKGE